MSQSQEPPPVVAPFAADSVAWEPWEEGVRFGGRVRPVGAHAGGSRIGVLIEELPPARQSVPFHWHTREEEHIYFLSGRATLRLGEARHRVQAGDYVCFPAGRPLGHCLINDSDAPCTYLVIGERSPDDVCFYPDSQKVMVRSAGRLVIADRPARDYWEGESADEAPG